MTYQPSDNPHIRNTIPKQHIYETELRSYKLQTGHSDCESNVREKGDPELILPEQTSRRIKMTIIPHPLLFLTPRLPARAVIFVIKYHGHPMIC
jgi:hypothetical protein